MGSSLPPAELARRDSALFEKMECIFSIVPVGSLEKSRRTLVVAAPDAGPEHPVWCQFVAQVCRAHRTLAPDAGRLLFERLVVRDVSECARGVSDR